MIASSQATNIFASQIITVASSTLSTSNMFPDR